MKLGQVFYFVTDKAKGYPSRPKFHVYLCESNWQADGRSFLFISKANYDNDYLIRKADYPFLTLDISYITCGNITTYSEAEFRSANPRLVGAIYKSHLAELYHQIAASETMEGWQIKMVCGVLKNCL